MKNRIVRLAAAGAIALGVSAPLTAPADAFMCTPLGEPICQAYSAVCARIPAGGKYPIVHKLLCESFQ